MSLPRFSDDEKLRRYDLARRVAARIPFGWSHGRLAQADDPETQRQVVQWACDVANALGVDDVGLDPATLRSIEARHRATDRDAS